MIIVTWAVGTIIFLIFLFRMELYLRVVASSLAVCLFTTNVVIESIMVKCKTRMARIIQWISRNEKVWDITTAIDSQFVFPQLHAIIISKLSICSRVLQELNSRGLHCTCHRVLLLCSDNNHLVFTISIHLSPLSSCGDPVQAWSSDHPNSRS